MAVSFLNRDISDLCLGKPALRWITADATVSDAVAALKRTGETHLSVWSCTDESCKCVGKICMADVICFLAKEDNFASPFKALEAKVSEVFPKGKTIVQQLEPNSRLLEAIDFIIEGVQNLVIPIRNYNNTNSRKKHLSQPSLVGCTHHNGCTYCWLTQEDVVRFLLNSINVFNPIPTFTINSLELIDHDIMTVYYHDPAVSALDYVSRAIAEQKSIAVVDQEKRLIGEISPFTLACCDETVAAVMRTLSAGDLMAYIDCGGPPDDLVQLVKMKLAERNFGAMLELMEEEFSNSSISCSSSSCSSDDESGSFALFRYGGSGRNSPTRGSEAIACVPKSSVVAVMIQALAHRVSCVWVVDEDHTVIGALTFAGILKVFRSLAGWRSTTQMESVLTN